MTIQQIQQFDASAVKFDKLRKNKMGGKTVYLNTSDGGKIYIELPYMRAPFGLSAFTDESSGRVSYSLDLSFDATEEGALCLEKMRMLDERIFNTVIENSAEWLGKKFNPDVARQAEFHKPIVRVPKKPEYPNTMKLKVPLDRNGDFLSVAYNNKKQTIPITDIEKGQRVKTIIEVSQMWFMGGNNFGVTMRLHQCLLEPSKKLPSFAFENVDVVDEDDEDEDECDASLSDGGFQP